MGVKVKNIDKAVEIYKNKGGQVNFKNDLLKIFKFAERDSRINYIDELAYLLATAEVESNYSLSRWEADYVCRDENGISMFGRNYLDFLPNKKPCNEALNYYCSTQGGKQNYCLSELDSRGLPYFGRGLIQITGKNNYKKYGDLIDNGLGNELIKNPDLVVSNPKISYDLAVAYLNNKKGGVFSKSGKPRNAFDLVKDRDLTLARRFVNGGTRDINAVNNSFDRWKSVFKSEKNPVKEINFSIVNDKSNLYKITGFSLVVICVVGLSYLVLKSRNK